LIKNSQPFGKKFQKTVGGIFFDSHCKSFGNQRMQKLEYRARCSLPKNLTQISARASNPVPLLFMRIYAHDDDDDDDNINCIFHVNSAVVAVNDTEYVLPNVRPPNPSTCRRPSNHICCAAVLAAYRNDLSYYYCIPT